MKMPTIGKKVLTLFLLMTLAMPVIMTLPNGAYTAQAAATFYKVNAKSGLRMRAGATVDSRAVHTIKYGTQVKLLATKGNWGFVETRDGKRGYCYKTYLTPKGQSLKPNKDGNNGGVKKSGKLYFINSVKKVKVYKSNSTKSSVRGKLNGGTVVRLISYKGNWGYIETYNTGKKGFIQLKYLKKY